MALSDEPWLCPTHLLRAARKALEKAYAPYSHFPVGAALGFEGSEDTVVGVNVENLSYGLTVCAERVAVASALARGLDLKKVWCLVVASKSTPPAMPCGACRQVLIELLRLETRVVCANDSDAAPLVATVGSLLPNPFCSSLSRTNHANEQR